MTDSEFDALLRRALIDVICEDYADILEGEPEVPPHTEKYLRRERKLLADPLGYVRRLARPVWKKTLRTVACILLALATLFGAVMAVSPSARAWVVRMYTEWREEFTKFAFFGSNPDDSSSINWKPQYLPNEFEEFDTVSVGRLTRITYQNPLGDKIYFSYRSFYSDGAFNIDNEHGYAQQITIWDAPATLLISNDSNYRSYLAWTDKFTDTAFLLSGWVGTDELICIAENVDKVS